MDQAVLQRVLKSPRLPSLPAVALQIIDLVQQPDVSLDDLAVAISKDPALASKILKTANSGFYARSRRVSRLSEALVVLGLRRVKTLALGFSLVEDLKGKDSDGFDHTGFWLRSLYAATVARALAPRAGITGQAEEAFLGGLTHCLGMLALNQAVRHSYQALVAEAGGNSIRLLPLERDEIGVTHSDVGGALAEQWNLPNELAASMRFYGDPMEAPADVRRLVQCVTVGAYGADLLVGTSAGESLSQFRRACQDWFGLPPSDAEDLLCDAHEAGSDMAVLLDIKQRSGMSAGEILALANEALAEISFDAEEENVRLESEKQQLAKAASQDGLTGLANRRTFDEFLDEQVDLTEAMAGQLSLMIIDLDHFKSINDTYGHQAGDEVLRSVADVLAASVREVDLPARYGGEEFAVVMPETGIRGATLMAQRLRKNVAALEIAVPGGKVFSVTASVGVAGYGPSAATPEALLGAADSALYEAKHAGRNTVRIATMPKAA